MSRPGASPWPLVGLLYLAGLLGKLSALAPPGGRGAGRWGGLAALAAVGGSATAALMLRHGTRLRAPVLPSLGLPPLLLFGVFTAGLSANAACMFRPDQRGRV